MRSVVLTIVAVMGFAAAASAASIEGQYLETRNANMWAGPCLVNAEVGITGEKALLAWKVNAGKHKDVQLDGLTIVAVVSGDRTFGVGEKAKTQTVFVVDERASTAQRDALVEMAKSLAGETIGDVVAVKQAKVKLEISQEADSGAAVLDAGIATVRTRTLRETDNLCGVEMRRAYPVLAKVSEERPAFTLLGRYAGSEFEGKYSEYTSRNTRGSLIGKFAL
jgi:hypothetical protein